MSRRRNSTMIDEYVPNTNLSRAEQMELQGQYKKTPHANGGVTFYDYINILKSTSLATKTPSSSLSSRGSCSSRRLGLRK